MSNEFPNRHQANLIEGESDIPTLKTKFMEEEDICGDEGEFLSCVLERILLAQKKIVQSQCYSTLLNRCCIEGKVSELIIDSGCM